MKKKRKILYENLPHFAQINDQLIYSFSAKKQLKSQADITFLCMQLRLPDSGFRHHADQAVPPCAGDRGSCAYPIAQRVPNAWASMLCVWLG